MLEILFCLSGIFLILALSQFLEHKKIIAGELQRKFVHITGGIFIAFWPWLISWEAISWIGVAMLLLVLFNHRLRLVDFYSQIGRDTYGDVFFALAVILLPLITHDKVYFALAMLIMAIGDSLASLIGQKYGQNWSYSVFNNKKTVIGSMTMWFASFCILAAGLLLFANDQIGLPAYSALILLLPPILALVENVVMAGMDNLAIPVVVLLAFQLVA